jgi:hypothetical protein
MRSSSGRSWLDIEEPGPLDFALYVRDSLGLDVDSGHAAPSRVPATDLPDHSGLLKPGQAARAAAAWPRWWRSLLAQSVQDEYRMRSGVGALDAAVSAMPEDEHNSWMPAFRMAHRAESGSNSPS